ncbi:MAG: hypothetical protein HY615_16775 [Candidatus Rokubacteria bacterium]|nr:hypothetical protein [Candidatus Rokubacteria bacterium]
MSARIVVNLAQGLAQSAIDRGPDGGTWLSLSQGGEVVIVKLSAQSLEALHATLAKELGTPAADATAAAAGERP